MHRILGLFLITITGLGFMVYSSSHGQARAGIALPYSIPTDPQAADLVQAFDRYFMHSMAGGQGAPGAAVAIVKDGEVIFSRGYGVRRAGGADSVDVNTVFRIGSLSKGFASVLSAVLVQEGVFKWDDRVQQYFPEFQLRDRAQAQRVNLTHVLSHTTGLPYHAYTNLVEAGKSVREINGYFPQAPLAAKEGVLYTYQNAVYSVVQEMMLSATGKTYQELLAEKIFKPAGMAHASVRYDELMAVSNKAFPHRQTRAGWMPDNISTKYYNAAPAGGVNASIADMGAWLQLLMGKRPEIITGNTLAEVFRPRVRSENERRFFRNWPGPKTSWYALGWRVIQHDDDTIVFHGGYVNDYKSEIAFDQERGIGICVLFNGPAPLSKDCVPAFFDLCEQYYPSGVAQKR